MMADLLSVLHDIDRLQGRVCGTCAFYVPIGMAMPGYRRPHRCRRGMKPYGLDDGCAMWRPEEQKDAAA
jgi:hypothetical protein